MLLVVDVGNTNITFGVFEEDKIVYNFRLTTKTPHTSDEYGIMITGIMNAKFHGTDKIDDIIIASVVPNIMHSLINSFIKFYAKEPIVIKAGTKTGIKMVTGNPHEIGADRIVDAAGAIALYGGPIIVIDFGTATTYDLILEDGAFVAGITSPGIRISAKALWEDTAKLPEIEIKKPDSILAKNTITSMQAGLIYGHIGQTEYIIRKIKQESKLADIKVVATGGLGKIIADETKDIDIYNPELTLQGLRVIYNKCKKTR